MDGNENVKKRKKGLISKTTTSHVHHTFLYIPFPFFHDRDVKMPNFAFYAGRKRQATTKFYFSFWAWRWSFEIQLQEGRNNRYKTERTQSHILSDVLVAVASLDLKVPTKVPIVLTWMGQSVYVEKRWPSQEGDSQKVDPARRVAFLAKPTFRFSFKRFAWFCMEM